VNRKVLYKEALGVLAVIAGIGLFVHSDRLRFASVQPIHIESRRPLIRTPAQWPTDHRVFNNNSAYGTARSMPGPQYELHLPTLVSSDAVIVHQTMYLALSSVGHNPNAILPGMVVALRPRNGSVLWKRILPNSVPSEPIVAQGIVFVGEGNAVFRGDGPFPRVSVESQTIRGTGPSAVYAFSARTGHLLWDFPTFGSDQPSPTWYRNKLYVVTGGRQLFVLNPKTGHVLWHLNLDMYVSRSSPRVLGDQLFVGGGGPETVLSVNIVTHRIVWRKRIRGAVGGLDDTPLALAGTTLYGEAMIGSPTAALHSLHHHEILFALNVHQGQLLWQHTIASGMEPRYKQGSTPMVHDSTLYVGNAINGEFLALNRRTGALLWAMRFPDPVTRPAAWVDGDIIGLTCHGLLFVISQAGQLLRKRRIGPWVNAYGPVILGSSLFASGNTARNGFLLVRPWTNLP